jgi:hypothetical protein
VAKLVYHGKNGNPAIDLERIESLRLANAIARSKLARIDGEVVSKRQVTFMLGYTLTLLRTQILTIPQLVSAELRALDNAQAAHSIRMRVEKSIYGFLEQLSVNMERAHRSDEFIAAVERELSGVENSKDTAELKQDLAKKRRTAKRHAKQRR